jgi:diguanylate cyclase (GGDEF)-like protein
MNRRNSVSASDELPLEGDRGLIESLYADPRSMIMGAAVTALGAVLIAGLTRSLAPATMTLVVFTVVLSRISLIRQYRLRARSDDPAEVRRLERAYVLGAAAYLFSIGVLTFSAFAVTDDPFILTLVVCAAITHALSIAVRNYAIQRGVGLQIAAMAVPLSAAFAVKGGLFPLAIPLMIAPLCLFIHQSASRLRKVLISEIAFRSRSEKIAAQFDFAINNMSHGMCMISADQRILVSNSRFSEFLGLPPERSLAHARLAALLRLAGRSGAAPREAIDELRRALEATALRGHPYAMAFETSDRRAYDVTLTPNARGGSVMVVQDVTAKRNADRAIDRMAHFDSVTGLRNRRSFELALADALSASAGDDNPIDVMFLDLDDFKQVNDSLGHRMGDKLLIEIASRLSGVIGPADLVARWGGDEFVILHRNRLSAPGTEDLARRIIREIGRPVVIDGSEVIIGASIGSASAPDHGTTPDALLSNADIALYAAKAEGRSGWRAFEPAMDTKIQVRRLVELELRAAVATDAVDVHFQPILDVRTRRILSFEALARLRHPVRGAVSPAEFIPILEDIGLMEAFGASMLRHACAACAKWPEPVTVSVNLSPSQFRGGRIEAIVADALARSGLAASRLDLEITESTLLDDRADTRSALTALRARGCRISLDDFGTGYSSLSYLLSFPLDRIKIDRSFTLGLGEHERASVLVDSVSAMSRKLGMTVLIEGVETEKQMAIVERLGTIAEAQGFLFSPPVPLSAVGALLERERQQARAAA